jgi:subtilisin family serine protease
MKYFQFSVNIFLVVILILFQACDAGLDIRKVEQVLREFFNETTPLPQNFNMYFESLNSLQLSSNNSFLSSTFQPYILVLTQNNFSVTEIVNFLIENSIIDPVSENDTEALQSSFFAIIDRQLKGPITSGLVVYLTPIALSKFKVFSKEVNIVQDSLMYLHDETPIPYDNSVVHDSTPIPYDNSVVHDSTTQPFPSNWGLDRIDSREGLTTSFTYTDTGAGVDAYILDSGINIQHVDFTNRIDLTLSRNFSPDQSPNDVSDCNGHGSHVSGICCGSSKGVAKEATIIAVRIFDCGNVGPLSQVLEGINYIISTSKSRGSRRAVVNMSFGGSRSSILDDAIKALHDANVAVSASAGNEVSNACEISPAGSPFAFTVAASDIRDTFASYSNFGPCVSVIAPGNAIESDWIGSNVATHVLSGTSMSAPFATGIMSTFLQSSSTASVSEVYSVLTCSGTPNLISQVPVNTPDLLVYTPPSGWNGGCVPIGASGGSSDATPVIVAASSSVAVTVATLGAAMN